MHRNRIISNFEDTPRCVPAMVYAIFGQSRQLAVRKPAIRKELEATEWGAKQMGFLESLQNNKYKVLRSIGPAWTWFDSIINMIRLYCFLCMDMFYTCGPYGHISIIWSCVYPYILGVCREKNDYIQKGPFGYISKIKSTIMWRNM